MVNVDLRTHPEGRHNKALGEGQGLWPLLFSVISRKAVSGVLADSSELVHRAATDNPRLWCQSLCFRSGSVAPAGFPHPKGPGGFQGSSQGPAGNLAGAVAPHPQAPASGTSWGLLGRPQLGGFPWLHTHLSVRSFFHVDRTKPGLSEPLNQCGWRWAFVGLS